MDENGLRKLDMANNEWRKKKTFLEGLVREIEDHKETHALSGVAP